MMTCSKCHASVPDEMRFCLQCGSPMAAAPPPVPPPQPVMAAPPPPPPHPIEPVMTAPPDAPAHSVAPPAPAHPVGTPQKGVTTVPLKIAPTPVMAPRGAVAGPERSSGEHAAEIDEDALKKSFERQVTQPGAIVCRFCKGPIDLDGDFCEQCGAPVSEAAPPGMVIPKPQPTAPPPPPPPVAAAAPPPRPAAPTPLPRPPASAAPSERTSSSTQIPSRTVARPNPTRPPAPPPTPPAEEQDSGLMGRLKGLFKKS